MKNSRRRRQLIAEITERLMEDKYAYRFLKLSDQKTLEHIQRMTNAEIKALAKPAPKKA